MGSKLINATLLQRDKFFQFGDILEIRDHESFTINDGRCLRYDKLSELDLDQNNGVPSISIFRSQSVQLPMTLKFLERHPFGSQAFMPLHKDPYLVIVADDINGKPSEPVVFITNGSQGVNIKRNIWHGVLSPIIQECDFLVVDLSSSKGNVEEFVLPQKTLIDANLEAF